MKLGTAYALCQKYRNLLLKADVKIRERDKICYSIDESQIQEALHYLWKIPYMRGEVEDMLEVDRVIHTELGDTHRIRECFGTVKRALTAKVDNIIELCSSFNIADEAMGINIKMPLTESFTEFKENIEDLEFVLTRCPFLQTEEEKFSFGGMDVGSWWLSFIVTTTSSSVAFSILLNNVAAFIDKCMILRSHKLSLEEQKIRINQLKSNDEEKKRIFDILDDAYKLQVDTAIDELNNTTGCKCENGEDRGMAEQAFEKMNKLIDKGMQIYASLETPENVKALFEPLKMKYLSVKDEVKVLEKKENKED